MKRILFFTWALIMGLLPFSLYGRGGGGCLREGTPVATPQGERAVETLKPGDEVYAVCQGRLTPAKVCAVMQVRPDSFCELIIDGRTLLLTSEHPVETDAGEFCIASRLKVGDGVCCMVDGSVQRFAVQSTRQIPATAAAWNLLVSPCGTYVAGGVVVHNKGCFLPETLIRRQDGSEVPISQIRPTDSILAFTMVGQVVTAAVQEVITHDVNEYRVLKTASVTLHVTAEHPFYVGQGRFMTLERLRVGDSIYAFDGRGLSPQVIESITVVRAPTRVYNLHTELPKTFFANGVAVHNKGGGCLREGTPVLTQRGECAVESLKPGDEVYAVCQGRLTPARVCAVMQVRPQSFCELVINGRKLLLTSEHPVETDTGEFCVAAHLKAGDQVCCMVDGSVQRLAVQSARQVPASVAAWNLLVSPGGTYVAEGVVVHNKGCFLPETLIRRRDGSEVPISQIGPADSILAFTLAGQVVTATVQEVISHEVKEYRILKTANVTLHVTVEHPFYVGQGRFMTLERLKVGDTIFAFDGHGLSPQVIESITAVQASVHVYNLHTDSPNTFFANGIAVHNKGGGGYHGGSYHGSGGGGGNGSPWPGLIIMGLFIGIWIVVQFASRKKDENLDFVYRPSAVAGKRDKTIKLLEFLSRQDSTVSPQALRTVAEETFRLLQKCWQAREYSPMRPLMMRDLYADHCAQLEGMKRHHEINLIEGVKIDLIDLVNVRYTSKEDQREFTALITATARDYYVDDRTRRKTRGDNAPAQFQEFWTFQRQGKGWLLREIEQSRESGVLKEDNFFEQFTDKGVEQIYGDLAKEQGAAGPWLEKRVEFKATRIERMLNFLVQTDRIWDRTTMLETTRRVFLELMASWESGAIPDAAQSDLFPDVLESLREQAALNRKMGLTLEFRNLCIRKVELILIRNFSDNTKDEFVVRIRAHAQRVMTRNGTVVRQDDDVVPFEQHLTLGRLNVSGVAGKQWCLKEIIPQERSGDLVSLYNLDEDSNLQQLHWYYQHKRAV